MTDGKKKDWVKVILPHIVDAQKLLKAFRKPIVALVKDGCEFYKEVQAPLHKLTDIVDKRQAERLFDLVHNVKLTSRDAVRVLEVDSRSLGDLLGAIINSGALQNMLIPIMPSALGSDGLPVYTPGDEPHSS